MATHCVIYGNGKVSTCIKSITSLIIAHAATNLLYLNLVLMYSIEPFNHQYIYLHIHEYKKNLFQIGRNRENKK